MTNSLLPNHSADITTQMIEKRRAHKIPNGDWRTYLLDIHFQSFTQETKDGTKLKPTTAWEHVQINKNYYIDTS